MTCQWQENKRQWREYTDSVMSNEPKGENRTQYYYGRFNCLVELYLRKNDYLPVANIFGLKRWLRL